MYDFDINKLWKDHVQYDDYVTANLDRREEIRKFVERCVPTMERLLTQEIEDKIKEECENNNNQVLNEEYDRGREDGKNDIARVLKQLIEGDAKLKSIKDYIKNL